MGLRGIHLSVMLVLKLKDDIKLRQGPELELLCRAMCVENVGAQRERRMELTRERNKRRPYSRRERQMETITENSISRLFQGQIPHLSLGFLELTPIS